MCVYFHQIHDISDIYYFYLTFFVIQLYFVHDSSDLVILLYCYSWQPIWIFILLWHI